MKRIKLVAITSALALLCCLSFIACQTRVTITLNPNGGSGGTTAVYPIYGELLPEAEAPVRPGYKFEGYFDQNDVWYYGGDMSPKRTWQKDGDLTLYAGWTALKYEITLDQRQGTGGTPKVMATTGQPLPFVIGSTRAGYEFLGYYDQIEGGNMYYDQNMNGVRAWDIPRVTSLYAQWGVLGYKVTLDALGGTGGTEEITVNIAFNMPNATAPSLDDHTFVGYYSMPNGKGVKYYDANMSSAHYWPTATGGTLYAYYAPFINGKGLKDDPFIINNEDDFEKMRTHSGDFKGLYFALGGDINCEGREWVPIGINKDKVFAGHFDGKGFTISNYKISTIYSDNDTTANIDERQDTYAGIFGYVTGSLSNFKVKDFTITSNAQYSGGLVGHIRGNIENCTATNGSMTISGASAGSHGLLIGFIGETYSSQKTTIFYSIKNCSATANADDYNIKISSPRNNVIAGGLIGTNSHTNIENCYAKVNVSVVAGANGATVGGLIGRNDESSMYTSYSTGRVFASSSMGAVAGGLVGNNHGYWYTDIVIKNCYTTGDVTLETNLAGLAPSVTGGGFIGSNDETRLYNCYASGTVSVSDTGNGTIYASGMIGRHHNNPKDYDHIIFTNCVTTSNVTAIYYGAYTYYGNLFSNNGYSNNVENSYRYDAANITASKHPSGTSTIAPAKNSDGKLCTKVNLNNASFYTGTLKWDASIWDFTDLSLDSGKLPTLK